MSSNPLLKLKKCRICLTEREKFEFNLDNFWDEDRTYRDLLSYLLNFNIKSENLQLEENSFSLKLPNYLCGICEVNLVQAYSFKKCYIDSEQFLLKEYQNLTLDPLISENEICKVEENLEEFNIDAKQNFRHDQTIENVAQNHKEQRKEKKCRCPPCKLSFPNRSAYDRHRRQMHRLLCTNCGDFRCKCKSSKSQSKTISKERFKCDVCDRSYTEKGNLLKHQRKHNGDFRYTCEYCQKKFINWSSRRAHIRIVHTMEKNYECEICGKKFAHSSHFFTHKRSHTGEKPHECPHCDKAFKESWHLKGHIQIHTGERNVICEFCSKKLSSKKSLKTHLRTHTGERPYICPICESSFTNTHALRLHLKKLHPNVTEPPTMTKMIGENLKVVLKNNVRQQELSKE